MGELLQGLRDLSLVLIVCALLDAVLPPSRGKRAFRLLCAVVIFCALLSPLKGFDLSDLRPEALLTETSELEALAQSQSDAALRIAARRGWETAAAETLRNAGVPFRFVRARCETENGQPRLLSLAVTGVPAAKSEAARNALVSLCEGAPLSIITEESQ